MNIQNALEWIVSLDTGISSKTMWAAIMGVTPAEADVPHDVADFGRCYRMIQKCEATKADISVVAVKFPFWKPVIDNWDKLCRLYEGKGHAGVGALLCSLRDEIMQLKGYNKTGSNTWSKRGVIFRFT